MINKIHERALRIVLNNNHEIFSEEITKSPAISNEIDTPTSTESVIEKVEDQLNQLCRKFSKHEAQFAMMMNELLEVKNKYQRLNSGDS